MLVRGLKVGLNAIGRYNYKPPEFDVDHLVIGAGAVGLAVGRALTLSFPDKTTYVVERNANAGEETSSRNSEVIHAGLYYPSGSSKEKLCIQGRHLLYNYCKEKKVPHRKTGKLIVASRYQSSYVESLHRKASKLKWPPGFFIPNFERDTSALPTELVTGAQIHEMEPDISKKLTCALHSPETGIIDSHTYMTSLEEDIAGCENGELVYSTAVVRIDPHDPSGSTSGAPDTVPRENGWVVQMRTEGSDGSSSSADAVFARTIINAGGLSAPMVLNTFLPYEDRLPMYYAKGSYAAYSGPGIENVSRLLYPCPESGRKGNHSFQSLGTHLTLDLAGNVKFGPDIQWINPPSLEDEDESNSTEFSSDSDDVDYWKRHLTADDSRLDAIAVAVKHYLPDIDPRKFRPDYVGIRPKLAPPEAGFQDFVFREDRSFNFVTNKGTTDEGGRMISLLGIESPGLTASLAIAEEVVSMLERAR